jgi:hypothetical protein
MAQPASDEKTGAPAKPAQQPKPQSGQGTPRTGEPPVRTDPNKPNEEAFDPRAPG